MNKQSSTFRYGLLPGKITIEQIEPDEIEIKSQLYLPKYFADTPFTKQIQNNFSEFGNKSVVSVYLIYNPKTKNIHLENFRNLTAIKHNNNMSVDTFGNLTNKQERSMYKGKGRQLFCDSVKYMNSRLDIPPNTILDLYPENRSEELIRYYSRMYGFDTQFTTTLGKFLEKCSERN